MTELGEALSKYQTVESTHCLACGNPWFFDKGLRLTCTTCGHDKLVYEIDEDPTGYSGTTGAWITSDTEEGLERGISAYFTRYMPQGYSTRQGEIQNPSPGKWRVRMTRYSSCD